MNTRVLDGSLPVANDTLVSMRRVLEGQARGWQTWLKLAGPAVVVSVAYVDPGNVATNIQAGARYGYSLLWVALAASLVAMLFQALSAKLGIVSGRWSAKWPRWPPIWRNFSAARSVYHCCSICHCWQAWW